MNRTTIRDSYGKILGYVEEENNGNKRVTDFYGKVLGFYYKAFNQTKDFYGNLISLGDTAVNLIYKNMK